MDSKEVKILIICDDENHLKNLIKPIHKRDLEIAAAAGRPGAKVNVSTFARVSDLNGTESKSNINWDVIVLSSAGRADPPYDLWVLRHKFPDPLRIAELDINTQERVYHFTCCWGADDVFIGNQDMVNVIIENLIERRQRIKELRHQRIVLH